MAVEAKRFDVKNDNNPNIGNVTEEKESELEEFIEYSKIIMGVLGYKVFLPLGREENSQEENIEYEKDLKLFLNKKSNRSKKEINAKCLRTKEGFVVLKGSTFQLMEGKVIPKHISNMRKKADKDEIKGAYLLKEDILFNSQFYAASFVIGSNAN